MSWADAFHVLVVQTQMRVFFQQWLDRKEELHSQEVEGKLTVLQVLSRLQSENTVVCSPVIHMQDHSAHYYVLHRVAYVLLSRAQCLACH